MTLEELVRQVPQFDRWGPTDQIRFIAWYFHVHEDRADYEVGAFRCAYEALNLTPPSSLSQLITQLVDKEDMNRKAGRLSLGRRLRVEFDGKYGRRQTTVAVAKLLRELPMMVPGLAERAFLDEAIKCFEVGAYRAATVMSWNLAFDHFLNWVFKNHLTAFNAQWPVTFPTGKRVVIAKREDFADAAESKILQVCRMANIITGDQKKMLDEKLDKRNSAAHPSDITFGQAQTEGYIEDLVHNVVLKPTGLELSVARRDG